MLLPTPAAIAFTQAWADAGAAAIDAKVSEQKALPELAGTAFRNCSSLCQCFRANHEVRGGGGGHDAGAWPAAAGCTGAR